MDNKELILKTAFGERDLFFIKMDGNLPVLHNVTGLGKVIDNIKAIESKSRDKNILLKNSEFVSRPGAIYNTDEELVQFQNIMLFDGEEEYPMSNWGLGQACNTLGVPSSYIQKCIWKQSTDLAVSNMNYWAEKEANANPNKEYLARLTDDRMYGFLSTSYCTYDDSTFLNQIVEALPAGTHFHIMNSTVSPEITKVRIISDEKMIIDGDEYSIGLDVSNSRVGRSSVKLELLIFRWICSNGQIYGGGRSTVLQKIHRNIENLSIEMQIVVIVQQIPELLVEIKTWIEAAKANTLNQHSLDMLLDGFRARAINSESATRAVRELMNTKYNETMWGYTQAIAELAQSYSIFQREPMERYSGQMLFK
jgi:hypothetical protein